MNKPLQDMVRAAQYEFDKWIAVKRFLPEFAEQVYALGREDREEEMREQLRKGVSMQNDTDTPQDKGV